MGLLTVEEVCRKLRIKKSYLYYLTHLKIIPRVKLRGHLRFDEADVDKWTESLKKGGKGDECLQKETQIYDELDG